MWVGCGISGWDNYYVLDVGCGNREVSWRWLCVVVCGWGLSLGAANATPLQRDIIAYSACRSKHKKHSKVSVFCVRKENEMTTCVRAWKVERGRRAKMRVTMMHLITKDGRSRPYSRPSRHSKCPCNNTQILKIISGNLFRIHIIENATSPHDIRSRPKTRAHICTSTK